MKNKFVGWSRRKYGIKQRILGFLPVGFFFLVGYPLFLVYTSQLIDTKLNLPTLTAEPYNLIIALPLITIGLLLSAWSVLVQFRAGKGTPVPVMPTQRLITDGPYGICRNPMTLGIVVYYIGISIYITSLSSVVLTSAFLLLSTAYIKLVEEKELEAKFGEEYREYRKTVPFLVPRLRR